LIGFPVSRGVSSGTGWLRASQSTGSDVYTCPRETRQPCTVSVEREPNGADKGIGA